MRRSSAHRYRSSCLHEYQIHEGPRVWEGPRDDSSYIRLTSFRQASPHCVTALPPAGPVGGSRRSSA